MKRYIDAEKILPYISRLFGAMPLAVLKMAEKDGIDIVRCKVCVKSKEYRRSDGGFYRWCHENIREVKADDFCSYGESKEGK